MRRPSSRVDLGLLDSPAHPDLPLTAPRLHPPACPEYLKARRRAIAAHRARGDADAARALGAEVARYERGREAFGWNGIALLRCGWISIHDFTCVYEPARQRALLRRIFGDADAGCVLDAARSTRRTGDVHAATYLGAHASLVPFEGGQVRDPKDNEGSTTHRRARDRTAGLAARIVLLGVVNASRAIHQPCIIRSRTFPLPRIQWLMLTLEWHDVAADFAPRTADCYAFAAVDDAHADDLDLPPHGRASPRALAAAPKLLAAWIAHLEQPRDPYALPPPSAPLGPSAAAAVAAAVDRRRRGPLAASSAAVSAAASGIDDRRVHGDVCAAVASLALEQGLRPHAARLRDALREQLPDLTVTEGEATRRTFG